MLRFGREHETWIDAESLVLFVVVVIDPHAEPRTQPIDERSRHLIEAAARRSGERDIQHSDAPFELARSWKLPWSPER
jgi:hypothetical protein